ncbi:MAG TPA: PSD1 and planctomycete cytochrome C domain-containing protein [Pirellulales bacterium]|nr:PSD1 and planctomycete cytochrome C domain-containing protein [Pirellulales bacterium]
MQSTCRSIRRLSAFVLALVAASAAATAAEIPSEHLEFFEKQVRPLLAEHCYECHSTQAKSLKGGLRLDSRDAVLKGGDSGEAVVPQKPDESNLIQAIRWQGSEMPPTGKLPADKIAVLERWVELGAPWPDEPDQPAPAVAKTYDWPALRAGHWAWRPVVRPPLPPVAAAKWSRNEIDRFVLARLEAAGLHPSPPAEPATLIRRLYFDLTGLPPTPEEVKAFVSVAGKSRSGSSKSAEAAYAAVVERLLESPAYGERWGRYWLDVARYSEGYGGFVDSAALPNAWRYRDWVVAAINADMPYDEFVRYQLAGDSIDKQHAVATGFLALGPTYIADGGVEEAIALAKLETIDDRVDTVTRGLMGMTVSCARCHDHRFDPYPQADYYSLAGVFNNTKNEEIPLASPEEVKAYQDYQKKIKALDSESSKLRGIVRKENRDLTKEESARVAELKKQIADLKRDAPEKYPVLHAVADSGSSDMPLAIRGNPLRHGPVSPRRFLKIVAGDEPPLFTRGSGRLDLADAIVDPKNPLTARVIVNRVWQHHFGFGLVRTASNFGTLGEQPSHPELLDWLASKFVGRKQGDFAWSLKRLHRAIVLSATYRMSSAPSDEALAIDGDNRLLWRMNPRRLDVEAWRDSLLAATGELDSTVGGPSVSDIAKSNRRTLYAAISRNGDKFDSDTFLRLFDFPVPRATSEGRTSSIVPQQSLFMMNSPFMIARAKAMAERVAKDAKHDKARIDRAYWLLYGRAATDEERQLGVAFLGAQAATDSELSRWQQYAQVLLSASEMMYIN